MMKKIRKIIFTLAFFSIFTLNVNAAAPGSCGTHPAEVPQFWNNTKGYCVDPGASGNIVTAVAKNQREELSGPILDWAQSWETSEKQQIAYRLISYYNRITHDLTSQTADCFLTGGYSDAAYVEVYNSWKSGAPRTNKLGITTSAANKHVNRTGSNSILMEEVSSKKEDGNFTYVIRVDAGKDTATISANKAGVNISPTTITGKGLVTVTGKLNDECGGNDLIVYANATGSSSSITNPGSGGSPGGNVSGSGTECKNNKGKVIWFYFFMPIGEQGFIIPVPDGFPIPGGCSGGKPGGSGDTDPTGPTGGSSTSVTTPPADGLIELDIDPDDCGNDCKADYSGDFSCEDGKETSEYFHETYNILGCITSDKNYGGDSRCGSIKKTTDVGKNVTTITQNIEIDLAKAEKAKYCKVYCVEDVDYLLPGKIKVNNGGYFKLVNGTDRKDITIKGTRRCYTSKINNKKYAAKMKEDQEKIIKQYNIYLEKMAYAELYSSLSNFKKNPNVCTVQSCSSSEEEVTGADGKKTKQTVYSISDTSNKTTSYTYTANVTYDQYKCNYNSSNGEASCTATVISKTVTEKDTVANPTKTSCGSTDYVSACGTVTPYTDDMAKATSNRYKLEAKHALDKAKKMSTNLDANVRNYKSCYNWTNNYCFKPKIRFEYDDGQKIYTEVNEENYLTSEDGDINGNPADVQAESKGYYSSVNSQYKGTNTGIQEQAVNYVYITGPSFERKSAMVDTTTHYVDSSVIKQSTFTKPNKKVCTYHPYGTIVVGDSCVADGNHVLLADDGYAFPVSLQKEDLGPYNYYLFFENIGVDGNDAKCDGNEQTNRLMGCELTDMYTKETTKYDDKYTCQYGSCTDCPVDCECPEGRDDCYVEDHICKYKKEGCPGTCPIICIGCINHRGDSTFSYKQVSLTEIFPKTSDGKDATKEVGYNWNTDPKINENAEKAQETIKNIEKENEKAYDTDPQYRVVITPTIASRIRKYNEEANKKNGGYDDYWGNITAGGYNNVTLICIQGIQCKSDFLNILEKEDVLKIRNTKWTPYKDGTAWK